MNDVEKRAQPVDFMELTSQRGGKIEAEAIHMHFQNPVAQAVHDQLQHSGMPHVQRVPCAGVVHVIARVVSD